MRISRAPYPLSILFAGVLLVCAPEYSFFSRLSGRRRQRLANIILLKMVRIGFFLHIRAFDGIDYKMLLYVWPVVDVLCWYIYLFNKESLFAAACHNVNF